jgi:uncharacterized protein YoxC
MITMVAVSWLLGMALVVITVSLWFVLRSSKKSYQEVNNIIFQLGRK